MACVRRSRSNSMCLSLPFRNDFLVGRELPVDHSRDEEPRADLEEEMVLATLVVNVLGAFGEQPAQLRQRLARQDGLDVVALGALVLHDDQRETVAVGGHERHRVGLEDELGAVQVVARVFAGDRKLRLGDHLRERLALDAWPWRRRRPRGGSENLPCGSVGIFELNWPPEIRDGRAALFEFDVHVAVRQRPNHFVKLLRRQRDRAWLAHGRFAAAAQGNFEVRGQQRHFIAAGFEQHVRQDGNRVLALDDLLEKLQFPHKIGFPGDQFHSAANLLGISTRRRTIKYTGIRSCL